MIFRPMFPLELDFQRPFGAPFGGQMVVNVHAIGEALTGNATPGLAGTEGLTAMLVFLGGESACTYATSEAATICRAS